MEDASYYAVTPPPPLISATAVALFPLVFAAAWLLDYFDYIGLGFLASNIIHELSRATAAWLCGHWAILVPAVVTKIGIARSTPATLLAAGALALLWWRSWNRDRYALILISGLLLLAMLAVALSWIDAPVGMLITLSGVAGEFALPGLCACLFFSDVSRQLRWDFWRYPLLLAAACGWLHSASLWTGVNIGLTGWSTDPQQARQSYLDWISAWPDASFLGKSAGDCYRLIHDYHWTTKELSNHYGNIAAASALAIIFAWLYGALSVALKPSPRV